jgi:hypothetical protein
MIRSVTRWCVFGVMVCAGASDAFAQLALRPDLQPIAQPLPPPTQADLHGLVRDDTGQPLVGAVVSALGATTAFAITDRDGRFAFRNLAAGPYLVRAHLQGYAPARGRVVQVSASGRALFTIDLVRLDPAKSPTILAAGVGPADVAPVEDPPPDPEVGEVAWRLRHVKRSVLKDTNFDAALRGLDDESAFEQSVRRAIGTPARLASALFADVSLNGQVDLLTSTSFDHPQDLFSGNGDLPRGVAYLALAAPTVGGEWRMRGMMTQGDLASWILAGSYLRSGPAAHRYQAGLSYGMQRYQGGNANALAAMRDGSRNAGVIYGYDDWTIAPRLAVAYGAEYASYDYLRDPRLFSPRASVTVKPFDGDNLRLRTTISHREMAPGAEEFTPSANGPWLPPERTFSSVSRRAIRSQRLDHTEIALERTWPGDLVLGVRAFRQRIDDQVVTIFGMTTADASATVGHYLVGSAGDFQTRGWGLSASRSIGGATRASLDYEEVEADRVGRSPDGRALARVAASVLRDHDRIHEVTTTVESMIAATSTRVFFVYKISTGFAASPTAQAMAARFDLQVRQALPFLNFSGAQVEMLMAVRDLFRDDPLDGSVYDELLVVRPPTRVLGGVTVRF